MVAKDVATHADTNSLGHLLPDQRANVAARRARMDMLAVVFGNSPIILLTTEHQRAVTVADDLGELAAWCAVNRDRIKRLLHISVDPDNRQSVRRAVTSLLDQLGLRCVTTKQDKATGKRTYALDSESLGMMHIYAARYVARERARIAALADDAVDSTAFIAAMETRHPTPTQNGTPAPKKPPQWPMFMLTDEWQAWPRGVALEGSHYELSPDRTMVRRKDAR